MLLYGGIRDKYPCRMAQRKYSTIVPFGLRLQPELKEQLEAFARQKAHSLNSEIAERLERSVKFRDELDAFTDGELIDELIRRYGRDGVFIRLGKE